MLNVKKYGLQKYLNIMKFGSFTQGDQQQNVRMLLFIILKIKFGMMQVKQKVLKDQVDLLQKYSLHLFGVIGIIMFHIV